MTRLDPRHVRQAQRFAFDPLRPVEARSEAEAERYAEFARDAAEDARIDYESEDA